MAEAAALFKALETLTEQVQKLTSHSHGGKKWDSIERYKSVKMFDGNSKEYEEFSNKLRSQIAAGDGRVAKLVESIEHDCTEEQLVKGKYDECIDETDV